MTSMNSTTNPQDPARNMADKLPFEPNRTAEFGGNQYFVLNVVNPDSATKTKDDIIAIRGIGGDVDPCDPEYPFAQERERLAKLGTQLGYDVEYPASVLIDSGNGLQPIYLLAEPLALPLVGDPGRAPLIERVEQLGRRLANVLGGDRVQNIDRLYRQPGTDNYPNEKKRARGRVKSRSAIVSSSPRRYSGLDELEAVVSHLEATIPPAGLTRAATPRSDNTGSVQRDPQAVNAMIATLTAADIRSTADLDPKLKARLDQLAAPVSYGTDAASLMSAASKLKFRGFTQEEAGLVLCAYQHLGEWTDPQQMVRHIARAAAESRGAEPYAQKEQDTTSMLNNVKPAYETDAKAVIGWHRLYRPAQWAEAFKEPAMLVEKLLPDDALTALAGYTGSGKTFVAADLAFVVAAGLPAFGRFKVLRSGPVVYCCAEGPGGLAHRRFAALAKVYTKGVMPPNLLISDEVVMLSEPNAAQNWIATIKAAGIHPVLFVNDTKGRSMAGADTNHEGPTYLHYNQLAEIKRAFQCAVIDVMHYGKNESAGIAGSQANSNAIDWSLLAAKPGDPQVPSLLSVMTLTLGKMKDDPSDADVTYLKATKVPLGGQIGSLILQPISKADYQAVGKARRGDDHRAEVEAMLDAAGAVTLEHGLTLDEAAEKLAGDPGERSEMEWNRGVEMWKLRLANGSRPPRHQPSKDPALLGLFAQSKRPGGKAQNFWFVEARLAQ